MQEENARKTLQLTYLARWPMPPEQFGAALKRLKAK
jgi:hypothetical protein